MVTISLMLSQLYLIFLISLAATFIIFPLVFLMSFVYDYLAGKYEKVPKVLLMLFVTFLAVFLAVFAIEYYLEFTLPYALSSK